MAVVGVLIKGMDYLFASRWHFACLPNSCCGLSTALAWLTSLHWLYCRPIWSGTQILCSQLLHTPVFLPISPPNIFFIPLKNCYDGTHTECKITYSVNAGIEFGKTEFAFHILNL